MTRRQASGAFFIVLVVLIQCYLFSYYVDTANNFLTLCMLATFGMLFSVLWGTLLLLSLATRPYVDVFVIALAFVLLSLLHVPLVYLYGGNWKRYLWDQSLSLGIAAILLLMLAYYLRKKRQLSKRFRRVLFMATKYWYVFFILSLLFGTAQVVVQYQQRTSVERYANESQVSTEQQMFLKSINAVEEMYLLHEKIGKLLGGRPLITNDLVEYYCSNPVTPPPFDALNTIVQKIYGKNPTSTFQLLGDIGYIACWNDGDVHIVFRGTQHAWEWVGNLLGMSHTWSTTDQIGKHHQINSKAKTLQHEILTFLKVLNFRQISIAGHSRGATLAYYLYLHLVRTYPKLTYKIFLFATPPLFDPKQLSKAKENKNDLLLSNTFLAGDIMIYLNRISARMTSFLPQTESVIYRGSPRQGPLFLLQKSAKTGQIYVVSKEDNKSPLFPHALENYVLRLTH